MHLKTPRCRTLCTPPPPAISMPASHQPRRVIKTGLAPMFSLLSAESGPSSSHPCPSPLAGPCHWDEPSSLHKGPGQPLTMPEHLTDLSALLPAAADGQLMGCGQGSHWEHLWVPLAQPCWGLSPMSSQSTLPAGALAPSQPPDPLYPMFVCCSFVFFPKPVTC